jgi:serine/threonine-protein kinase
MPRDTAIAETMLAPSDAHPRVVDVSSGPDATSSFDAAARYAMRRVLGAGGMGEVRLTTDAWIGRDVAMKVVKAGHGSTAETRGRFLREARVQGQLEHPSVVPVYDIGKSPDGEAFFTMKRIGGHTFEQIVDGLRARDAAISASYTRRKVLSAMSQVCLTVAYAHSRGVVHRDLKPSNVMLGDFGEVYVLDWGVAKIAGAAEAKADAISGEDDSVQTHAGALVGTPGYMSPEQARGDIDAVGPASDVYALGAMLFELLALEPLHTGRTVAAVLASTQLKTQAPSERAPAGEIAPELDAICVRATAFEPGDRFASARAMHEAIEAVLAGERDAERRKELAKDLVAKGRAALEKANAGGPDAERHRSEGMRALGHAVALDPNDDSTLKVILDTVLSASALPPEAEAQLKAVELADRARAARRSALMYATWLLFVPAIFVFGVRNWPACIALLAMSFVAIGWSAWMGTAPERSAPRFMRTMIVINFVLVGCSTTLFGPFLFAPAVAATSAAAFAVSLRANSNTRNMLMVFSLLSIFVPFALQLFGVIPASYAFHDGIIEVRPVLESFPPVWTQIGLSFVTAAQLVLPSILVTRAVDGLVAAERTNFAQAWRLKQLLPPAT